MITTTGSGICYVFAATHMVYRGRWQVSSIRASAFNAHIQMKHERRQGKIKKEIVYSSSSSSNKFFSQNQITDSQNSANYRFKYIWGPKDIQVKYLWVAFHLHFLICYSQQCKITIWSHSLFQRSSDFGLRPHSWLTTANFHTRPSKPSVLFTIYHAVFMDLTCIYPSLTHCFLRKNIFWESINWLHKMNKIHLVSRTKITYAKNH